MSEDLNVFPNARSKLFGDGENSVGIITTPAVAGLTGSLVMSDDLEQTPQGIPGTIIVSNNSRAHTTDGLGFAIATFPGITTPDNSVLVIVVASGTFVANSNNSKDWVIKRGTTVLDSFTLLAAQSNAQSVVFKIFFDTSPPAGTFTYTVNEDDVNTYGTIEATLFFVKGTDTHAGFIQSVAIAGKDIIEADSHRTHEVAVLPA